MFGKRGITKDYERIIKEIEEGERRESKHDRPTSLARNGFTSFVTPAHEVLFADFDWFGAVLDRGVQGPWSIEEMSDTLIRDGEDPDLGRRYKIYYHSIDMGTLQISVGGLSLDMSAEWFKANRSARAVLKLRWLRFVPYDDAHHLLSSLELFLGPFENNEAARARANGIATSALTACLWEAFRIEDTLPWFEHRAEGPYTLFRETADHWKVGGIDPFTKWYSGSNF